MHPRRNRTVLATVVALAVITAAGAAGFVWSGAYNVAANSQHSQPVYSLLEYAMHQSVRLRARDIEPPPLTAPASFEHGAMCYQDRCEQCHGGPGVAQSDIALGMQPVPGPLINANARWGARELYWITRNGITMSGMPAWGFQLADQDLWALVAFIERLSQMSTAEYRAVMAPLRGQRCGIASAQVEPTVDSAAASTGDPERGLRALSQYACNGCHLIPGVTGAYVHVGPPLAGIARRQLIAGAIGNTPDNMARWLRNPQSIDPQTAMPDLGITQRDARDMAAYLATLL